MPLLYDTPNRGRVYPSYDRLSNATALGRATVARALTILEQAGFLIRQRRFRRVAASGPGPRQEQTSNAYRPVLPERVLALLARWQRPAPAPDDAAGHVAERAEAMTAMRRQLSCRELAQTTVSGALGRALAALGAALDARRHEAERESHGEPETLPTQFIKERALCNDAPAATVDRPIARPATGNALDSRYRHVDMSSCRQEENAGTVVTYDRAGTTAQ